MRMSSSLLLESRSSERPMRRQSTRQARNTAAASVRTVETDRCRKRTWGRCTGTVTDPEDDTENGWGVAATPGVEPEAEEAEGGNRPFGLSVRFTGVAKVVSTSAVPA